MANRSLQFYGKAYGSEPVRVVAHINNQLVFDGTVDTVDAVATPDDNQFGPLFTIENSALFPTEFSGTVPMTVAVELGDIQLGRVYSNYVTGGTITGISKITGSINGRTLTVNSVEVGTADEFTAAGGESPAEYTKIPAMSDSGIVKQMMIVAGGGTGGQVGKNTYVESGSGNTWILAENLIPLPQGPVNLVGVAWFEDQGSSDIFHPAYHGTPAHGENTHDPRSSVTIDGVAQTPSRPDGVAGGTWRWYVRDGSTLACNLTVRQGSVAP